MLIVCFKAWSLCIRCFWACQFWKAQTNCFRKSSQSLIRSEHLDWKIDRAQVLTLLFRCSRTVSTLLQFKVYSLSWSMKQILIALRNSFRCSELPSYLEILLSLDSLTLKVMSAEDRVRVRVNCRFEILAFRLISWERILLSSLMKTCVMSSWVSSVRWEISVFWDDSERLLSGQSRLDSLKSAQNDDQKIDEYNDVLTSVISAVEQIEWIWCFHEEGKDILTKISYMHDSVEVSDQKSITNHIW